MHTSTRLTLALSALATAALTACGGGSSSSTATTNDTTSTDTAASSTTAFPTGVSVASPASLSSTSSVVVSAQLSPATQWQDWAVATWEAIRHGDMHQLAQLASWPLPFGQALASADKIPEAKVAASEIEAVAKGSRTLSQIGLNVDHLFNATSVNAGCFGPTITYANHDDGTPASGMLPSGDLGMWVATDTDTSQPCAAAELNKRLNKVKKQSHQAMLMMAAMRRAVAASTTLSMPSAGATTDLTSAMSTAISAVASSASIGAATISLNGAGTQYTYRLVVSRGTGASAESAEIVIRHTPGASATQFTGVMAITVSQLLQQSPATDAMGCSDQTTTIGSTTYYKAATATTLRYDRNGTALKFGTRSGNYCGAPSSSSTNYLADIASTDANGELDPAIHLSGGNTRGTTTGWRGNFGRFAGDLDKDTQAGDFVYVWQAGNLDGAGRGFAVHTTYNSSTEARALNAYYGYTAAITGTSAGTSSLLGMICNWAGPGNSHTPNGNFQSQGLTLASSATSWTLGSSLITYAPTVSCNSSSSMTFDANANGSIGTGEGASTTHNLDSKGTSTSVETEIESRGYAKPTYF